MRGTRLVFVEGIMGVGKTTTAWWLARQINRSGGRARFILEGPTKREPRHPLRVATDLPHPRAVWQDVTAEEYVALSLEKWRHFAEQVQRSRAVTVCDGLLFHGNMTDLFLMEANPAILREYVVEVLLTIRGLRPAIIYLRRPDISGALRAICAERGRAWESYQIDWKLDSPYARRRSLHGFDGLARLYGDYSAICDDIFAQLAVPRLAITNEGDWPSYRRDILAFLDLRLRWWWRLMS